MGKTLEHNCVQLLKQELIQQKQEFEESLKQELVKKREELEKDQKQEYEKNWIQKFEENSKQEFIEIIEQELVKKKEELEQNLKQEFEEKSKQYKNELESISRQRQQLINENMSLNTELKREKNISEKFKKSLDKQKI